MAGNGYGTVRTSTDAEMREYDAAPAFLRRVMQQAVAKWSARHLVDDYQELIHRRNKSSAQATAIIARFISSVDEPEDTYRVYGPDHPDANAHGLPLSPAENAIWSAADRGRT